MVQEIKGTSDLQSSLPVSADRKEKSAASIGETIRDYKISINKEIVETVTYTRGGRIESDSTDGAPDFSDLVARMLQRQGITWESAMAGETVPIDDEARAEAKALIADDGYWGVAQTSDRIFQFAIAGAGGDTQKLDRIKAAIQQGFDLAKEAMGGSLPDISSKTFDAVMEKLENWAVGESTTT